MSRDSYENRSPPWTSMSSRSIRAYHLDGVDLQKWSLLFGTCQPIILIVIPFLRLQIHSSKNISNLTENIRSITFNRYYTFVQGYILAISFMKHYKMYLYSDQYLFGHLLNNYFCTKRFIC